MTVLIADPDLAARFRAEREASEGHWRDEVWEGVYVVSPSANIEHQFLGTEIVTIVRGVIGPGAKVFLAVNVSDRVEGWTHNYREPDVALYLPDNPARNCGTHWCGGPDFAAEILSAGDLAREKRPFYARVGVRELLIVDRDPWGLELYRLRDGALEPAGRSSLETPDLLVSEVLPLGFRLVPGADRPMIEVTRTDGEGRWLI